MAALPQIPGYRVVRLISESKRSRMYLAEQESLSRQVALKVLSDEFYKDPQFKKRFIDGGKSGAQLNHPNILAVFDIGSVSGFPYIATEYLPGGTLRDRLDKGMEIADALRVARELSSALEFSHKHGINHRDLKPANVLFRVDGSAVLADPGILSATEQNAQMSIGSLHYMSPEQVQAETVDARSDLYALGVMFYEMLAGRLPFDAEDPFQVAVMHVNEAPPPLPAALARFQPLIDKLLAKAPADRPGSAQAVVDELIALSDTRTSAVQPAVARAVPRVDPLPPPPTPARPAPVAPAKPAPVGPEVQTAIAPAFRAPEMSVTTMMPNPTMVVERDDMSAAKPSPAGSPRKYKPKPRWPALLAVLVLIAVLVVGLLWVFGSKDMPAPGAGEAKPQESQLRGSEAIKTSPDVQKWLDEAKKQLARQDLVTPPDANAVLSYKKALSLDKGNAEARAGLEDLVDKLDKAIRRSIDEGKVADARDILGLAMKEFPDRENFKLLEATLAKL